jgi:ABC-2 type transport system permease protein
MAERRRRGPELTGTWRLVRLAARRDRILLPVWLLVVLGLLAGSVASIAALYPTEADRVQYARLAATNLVARAFDGLMSGTSLGAVVMTEVFTVLALLVGIMSVQAVVRHTRLEEETGRAELVDAAVVGRHARLVAALAVTLAANVVLAAGTALVLIAADLPTTGSVLAGLALAGVGSTFAAVAAVTSQVSGSSRGANGLGGLVLGVAFLLRAVGDGLGTVAPSGVEVVSAWPSWLSPIGWGQQVRPFGGDHAGLLLLFVGAVGMLLVTAFVLTSHRDHGAGLRAERPGPPRA